MRNPMLKIADVARREYSATAMTKAFVFGVIFFPLIIFAIISVAMPLLKPGPKVLEGTVAILDETGPGAPVATAVEEAFSPEAQQAEQEATREQLREAMTQRGVEGEQAEMGAAIASGMIAPTANVQFERLDSNEAVEEAKRRVRTGELIAVVVVPGSALDPAEGAYEIASATDLGMERVGKLQSAVETAIVNERIRRANYDPVLIRDLTKRPARVATTVTDTGELARNDAMEFLLPLAFMMLLWIAAFSSGQYLLTTTIEEKSSRVMELLLSAVSPMQLMTGKIVGQLLVGLTILVVYGGLGLITASQFNLLSLIPTEKLAWLAIYFLMAYFFIGTFMAAIGSAVNEMREAQSFMSVAMIIFMVPLFLWMPIVDAPNSTFSTVASLIPPLTPFVMILRLAQSVEPVPMWQIAASIVIGYVAVFVMIWAAAKIFRVGVLMYGKPPNFTTLVRWVRQA